jgi:hypothetical protein
MGVEPDQRIRARFAVVAWVRWVTPEIDGWDVSGQEQHMSVGQCAGCVGSREAMRLNRKKLLGVLDIRLLPRTCVYQELSSTKNCRLQRIVVCQELSTPRPLVAWIMLHVCMSVLVSWRRCYVQKWTAGDVCGSYEGQVTR